MSERLNDVGGGRGRVGTVRPEPLPSWGEYLGGRGLVKVTILAGLFLWLYWGQIYRMVVLWGEPDWSHGYLIPFFCLFAINNERRRFLTGTHEGSLWGGALMVLAVAMYGISLYRQIGYTQPLSMIPMLAGLVLLLQGWRSLYLAMFPICFLVLAMPPPERLYRALTQPLQQLAAAISTVVLNFFPGASVERMGFDIMFSMADGRAGSFAVAGACSGMRSLMAFIALGLAMAYFTPRPAWQRISMALAVIPVALFCNVLRVIITGAFQMYGHSNLATGTPHTILGLIMFMMGFGIYSGILWLLDHLYVEEDSPGMIAKESAGTHD